MKYILRIHITDQNLVLTIVKEETDNIDYALSIIKISEVTVPIFQYKKQIKNYAIGIALEVYNDILKEIIKYQNIEIRITDISSEQFLYNSDLDSNWQDSNSDNSSEGYADYPDWE